MKTLTFLNILNMFFFEVNCCIIPIEFFGLMSLKCPKKIRDKEQSNVNEFLEWRFGKVCNCWLG